MKIKPDKNEPLIYLSAKSFSRNVRKGKALSRAVYIAEGLRVLIIFEWPVVFLSYI